MALIVNNGTTLPQLISAHVPPLPPASPTSVIQPNPIVNFAKALLKTIGTALIAICFATVPIKIFIQAGNPFFKDILTPFIKPIIGFLSSFGYPYSFGLALGFGAILLLALVITKKANQHQTGILAATSVTSFFLSGLAFIAMLLNFSPSSAGTTFLPHFIIWDLLAAAFGAVATYASNKAENAQTAELTKIVLRALSLVGLALTLTISAFTVMVLMAHTIAVVEVMHIIALVATCISVIIELALIARKK